MNANTPQSIPCPNWETWCAYVDDSLIASDRPMLENHLRECDHCFTQLIAIKQSVEEPIYAMETTPVALLDQAIGTATKHHRWIPYAAAAALILGFGLSAIYQSSPPDQFTVQLAYLNDEIETREMTWPSIESDRTRGTQPSNFNLADRNRAAIHIGAALVQLNIELTYTNHRQNAQHQLNRIAFAQKQFNPNPILDSALSNFTFAQPDLSELHQSLTHSIQAQGAEIETYFMLGQWLQSARTTAGIAVYLSTSIPELVENNWTGQDILSSLKEHSAPRDLITDLTNLQISIERNDSPQTVLIHVDTLLNTLILP